MAADGGLAFPLSSIEICEQDLATQSKTKVLLVDVSGWCNCHEYTEEKSHNKRIKCYLL